MMHNPSFHTKHYREESKEMILQRKIEDKLSTFVFFLNPKHWFKR